MGGVSLSQVLGQFLIERQYRNGHFFASSLGKIAVAVACLASLSWAHDLITGLYCDASSLVHAFVFKLMCDCAGCFAVILGHWAVPCLLPYIWGWSTIIFDHIMTPIKNQAVVQARILPAA